MNRLEEILRTKHLETERLRWRATDLDFLDSEGST
jgi:hypothetical protein